MKIFDEFKKFAVKGNVIDMAVGVMLGAAFSGVVKALVDNVLMPPLGLLTGELDFTDRFFVLRDGEPPGPYLTLEAARKADALLLGYGVFANAILNFLIVACALFFLVRWINNLQSPDTPPAPNTKPCPHCKSAINKAATRCPHCTSELEVAA